MDTKKKLLILLVAVAIGVWGYNLYQLKGSMAPEYVAPVVTNEGDNSVNPDSMDLQGNTYAYKGNTRDPFQHWLFPQAPKTVKNIKKKPEKRVVKKPLPELAVQGIMGDMSNPMAIILDKSGKTHLCRVGQNVDGVEIVRIEQKSVVVTWEGDEHVVRLKK